MLESKKILNFLDDSKIFYEKDVSMKNLTSIKIGANAKFVVYPKNFEQVKILILFCKKEKLLYYFLGRGSNIIAKDEDFLGILISSKMLNKIKILSNNKIYCESGVSLFRLCAFSCENSFSGLENLYGIPGSLGGAIAMNAGAYGTEIKDVVVGVSHLDEKANLVFSEKEELNFSYRTSIFQHNNFFIMSTILNLKKGEIKKIKTKMEEVLKKRKEKQPLEFPNAGSVFKRPKNEFAAELIEECGLKGLKVGGAMVSEKHSGFIINIKEATQQDFKSLVEKIKHIVKIKKNVDLETEVKFLN